MTAVHLPRLSRRTVHRLSSAVSVPSYAPADLTPGIVHLGVSRFHRAHQAAYLDRLAEQGLSRDWGVVGVGMRSAGAHRALIQQDGLYTLCEAGADGPSLRVVGHLKDVLFAPAQRGKVLDALADPRTRIVSLTVSAQAYLECPRDDPRSAFGLLARALRARRDAGIDPFTVLSCDNIEDNGTAARHQVLAAADAIGSGLSTWVERHVSFPHSMVDRITPPLDDVAEQALTRELSVRDHCAVLTEPFADWVIEDDFCNERPPLEQVGVRLVSDAGPYKVVKTRLLNGSHCALGFLGGPAGFATAADAMADTAFRDFVEGLLRHEVVPLLPELPNLDLTAYQRSVLDRLSSRALTDPLDRLRARGSIRVPSYVLPALEDALEAGTPHHRLTLVVAAWVVQLRSARAALDITDPAAGVLHTLARDGGRDVRALISHRPVFGSLADCPEWVAELQQDVDVIEERGVRAALSVVAAAGGTGPRDRRTGRGRLHAAAS